VGWDTLVRMKILLTNGYDDTVPLGGFDIADSFSNLEAGDQSFRFRLHQPTYALHLLAQNLDAEVTVLEHHSLEEFEAELAQGYDVLGLSLLTVHSDRIAQMMARCRELSPGTRIVVGGTGIAVADYAAASELQGGLRPASQRILELADAVCRDEGTVFLRRFIGDEPAERPISQRHIPTAEITAHGLEGLLSSKQFMLVRSLGCPNGCDFCASSMAFRKQRFELLSAPDCFAAMKDNLRSASGRATVTNIQDDNLLDQHDFVRELGALIQADDEGLSRLGFAAFGSLRAMARYEPDELLELGVSHLFIGVESTLDPVLTSCPKRSCDDLAETFASLHARGITTTASFILGWEFHDHATLLGDIRQLAQLKAAMYHINLLSACPGTELFERLYQAGRVGPYEPEHGTAFTTDNISYKPLHYDDLVYYRHLAERWTYQLGGPQPLRRLEVYLQGLAHCRASSRPLLQQKARFLEQKAGELRTVLEACLSLAPNPAVYDHTLEIQQRCDELLGPAGPMQAHIGGMLRDKLVKAYEQRRNAPHWLPPRPALLRSHYRAGAPFKPS